LAASGLALRNVDSSDLNGSARVVVTAFVKAHQWLTTKWRELSGG
jgi:hypothetical protein